MQKAKKQKAEVFWACLAAPFPGKRQADFQKMEREKRSREALPWGRAKGRRPAGASDSKCIKVKATETL